jgi:hypothetical protein
LSSDLIIADGILLNGTGSNRAAYALLDVKKVTNTIPNIMAIT